VIERYDLDLASMSTAIKYFGDRSADADWAVVYYSGHGLEMNGIAYLIPVDARLERDTHVSDETVALSGVLEKVESARKLRLVILDACRNNTFVARMIRHRHHPINRSRACSHRARGRCARSLRRQAWDDGRGRLGHKQPVCRSSAG